MDLRPTFRPEEVPPQLKEFITEQEAKKFLTSISFSEFKNDFLTMVESSQLSQERKEEISAGLEKLYSRLERGFDVDTLKSQLIQTVSVDVSNGNEDELLQYFLFSMKTMYDKFRMTNPLTNE